MINTKTKNYICTSAHIKVYVPSTDLVFRAKNCFPIYRQKLPETSKCQKQIIYIPAPIYKYRYPVLS